MDIDKLLKDLTLSEKCSLLAGRNFWQSAACDRLGLPSVMLTDGPHGLRKQSGSADHLGLNESVPATCFPTASATACSFDPELLAKMGQALGEECRKEDVAVILGPGLNMKRSPLCGRNFEYFSEDPLLAGKLAAAQIRGIQSQGVGTSIKHFMGNNQEKMRMSSDSLIDERAMHEIYLRGFEIAVREAQPWTAMMAYNKVNGTFCSENRFLIQTILRDLWAFKGLTVTDWGAESNHVASVKAGLDLNMPGPRPDYVNAILAACESGEISEAELNACVRRVLGLIGKYEEGKKTSFECDMDSHLGLARQIAEESAVLLENNGILPLDRDRKLALIGTFAKTPRYQGAGSSKINPYKLDNAYDALANLGFALTYAPGYDHASGQTNDQLLAGAVAAAKANDIAVIFAGLPDAYESEGFDRSSLDLPAGHNQLIEAVAAANPNTVVVLLAGSPVLLPWREKVKAVLMMYLAGCQGGQATANLLSGKANPSGRLAETFPLSLDDTPTGRAYPVINNQIPYRESIYIGYRHYDKAGKAVLYPFGYGLSYTSFRYNDLKLTQEDSQVKITLTVTNSGARDGATVVQVYVAPKASKTFKAIRELKAFKKVHLPAGKSQIVELVLDQTAFRHFDRKQGGWAVEKGIYAIEIGESSRKAHLSAEINLDGVEISSDQSAFACYHRPESGFSDAEFEKLYGRPLPAAAPVRPFTPDSTLSDIQITVLGRLLSKAMKKQAGRLAGADAEMRRMVMEMMADMPLRSLLMSGLKSQKLNGLLNLLNGRIFKGIAQIAKK